MQLPGKRVRGSRLQSRPLKLILKSWNNDDNFCIKVFYVKFSNFNRKITCLEAVDSSVEDTVSDVTGIMVDDNFESSL